MIKLEHIHVFFDNRGKITSAVKNVSLEIKKGEVFGIVGTSGAGKSTLLRTINLLQRPTSGKVIINDQDISQLKGEALRKTRLHTGMIFQQFNLINSKTVYENIAFALKVAGKGKEEINARVPEVLELVGLTDRAGAYPSTLSGGQKQRVGIARAIANNPTILLCDEPTSALDLETTNSILDLLKEINEKLGITTVIISHEMDVIKKICDRVAVMDGGELLELNDVYSIFTHPVHPFTQSLVNHTLSVELPNRLLDTSKNRLLKITYIGIKAEDAVISEAARIYNVNLNILHGKIEYISNKPYGILVIQLTGSHEDMKNAQNYLIARTFKVEEIHA